MKYVKLYIEAEIDNGYLLDVFTEDVKYLHVDRKPFPSFTEKFGTKEKADG